MPTVIQKAVEPASATSSVWMMPVSAQRRCAVSRSDRWTASTRSETSPAATASSASSRARMTSTCRA
jgi:hypothetical protein